MQTRSLLDFAERFEFRPAESAIQLEGLTPALKNSLWNVVTTFLFPTEGEYVDFETVLGRRVRVLWVHHFKAPIDRIDEKWSSTREAIRKRFYAAEWYDVYGFIEFCAEWLFNESGSENELTSFESVCNKFLEREKSAYRLLGKRFIRNTSKEELAAVDSAQLASGKFSAVATHIQSALDHLTRRDSPDYRNSIKESISAVEAACCVIANVPKATLGQALTQLERQGLPMHAAQKKAFAELYGYTSDAEGIRHALLQETNLTYEDAQFMLVTCSAFTNYLRAAAKA